MNDGGPAFPKQIEVNPNNGLIKWGADGMSLRDWFAGKVLQGELASQNAETGEWPEGHEFGLAKRCYKIADAMIKEGEK